MNSLNNTADIEILSGVCDDLFSGGIKLHTDLNFVNKRDNASSSLTKEPISHIVEYNTESNCHNNLMNHITAQKQAKHSIITLTCNQGLSQTAALNTSIISKKDPTTISTTSKKSFFTEKRNAGHKTFKSRGIFKYLNQNYSSTNLKKKAFICNICGKDFFHKCQLNVHYRTHYKSNPLLCKICFREFTEKHFLDAHLSDHKEQFVCEICSESFSLRVDLDVHLRSHTKELPYTCEVCQESFSMKFTLNTHLCSAE